MLRVVDVLEAGRRAVMELRTIEHQKDFMWNAIGVHGVRFDSIPSSCMLDPSRHIDELVDWENGLDSIPDLKRNVAEAEAIVRGIATITDELTVRVLRERYLHARAWQAIADEISIDVPQLAVIPGERLRNHLRTAINSGMKSWEGYGVARLKDMGNFAIPQKM